MKNYLLVLFAFLLLAGCRSKYLTEDDNNKHTFIYIKVIKEIPEAIPDNNSIYDYIQLFDNHGNFAINNEDSIRNFTSPVYKNRKVKWKKSKGAATNRISRIEINPKSGSKNFLQDKKIIKDGIEFKVKAKDEKGVPFKKGDLETYTIIITINGIDYPIDPIITYHDDVP